MTQPEHELVAAGRPRMLAHVRQDVTVAPYRVLPPKPPDPYLAAWAELGRRHRAAKLTIVRRRPRTERGSAVKAD